MLVMKYGVAPPSQQSLREALTRVSTHFVTYNVQKDGRVNLGTAVHNDPNCPALKCRGTPRRVVRVEGELATLLSKCKHCWPKRETP